MLGARFITHHDPGFLKPAYSRTDVDLIDHERHIPSGTKYGSFDPGSRFKWKVWRMTRERVPVPLGAFESITDAVYSIKR